MMQKLASHRTLRFSLIEQESSKWNYSSRVVYDGDDLRAKPLTFGASMLAAYGLTDRWMSEHDGKLPPTRCQISQTSDTLICSSSGIVGLTPRVAIRDTLDHTIPSLDGYHILDESTICLPEPLARLKGRYLSLLLGGQDNHFHWLLMNFARLSILREDELANLNGILIPDCLSAAQEQLVSISRIAQIAPLIRISRGLAVQVDTLILPWNIASDRAIAPQAVTFLRNLLPTCNSSGRILYVDRRKSPNRPLLNEQELVEGLRKLGVEPVRFEELSMLDQARLCEDARLVIGPHGAGLANVAFCRPGATLLELMPNSNQNWTYRYLASSASLNYDCIFGHELPLPAPLPKTHRGPWVVSVPHVLAAVESLSASWTRVGGRSSEERSPARASIVH